MDDTISRQAAIDAYGDWYVEEGTEDGFIGTVKQLLEGLPSAQKTGKWEEKKVAEDRIEEWQSAKCSVCGRYHTTPYLYHFSNYDYCPSCGVRMEEEE